MVKDYKVLLKMKMCKWYTNKLDNTGEMDKFLERHALTKLTLEKLENLNTPIISKEIESQNYPQRKVQGDFPGGAVVKNPPASAGDTGSIPGPGRSHMPRSN